MDEKDLHDVTEGADIGGEAVVALDGGGGDGENGSGEAAVGPSGVGGESGEADGGGDVVVAAKRIKRVQVGGGCEGGTDKFQEA